nr:hypothetical protein Iba_chr02bCG17560 [Ipomoea batatas]
MEPYYGWLQCHLSPEWSLIMVGMRDLCEALKQGLTHCHTDREQGILHMEDHNNDSRGILVCIFVPFSHFLLLQAAIEVKNYHDLRSFSLECEALSFLLRIQDFA